MTEQDSYRIVAERTLESCRVQLIEDRHGGHRLRKISAEGKVVVSPPIHGSREALAEAREHFPAFVPFGGVPVDAT